MLLCTSTRRTGRCKLRERLAGVTALPGAHTWWCRRCGRGRTSADAPGGCTPRRPPPRSTRSPWRRCSRGCCGTGGPGSRTPTRAAGGSSGRSGPPCRGAHPSLRFGPAVAAGSARPKLSRWRPGRSSKPSPAGASRSCGRRRLSPRAGGKASPHRTCRGPLAPPAVREPRAARSSPHVSSALRLGGETTQAGGIGGAASSPPLLSRPRAPGSPPGSPAALQSSRRLASTARRCRAARSRAQPRGGRAEKRGPALQGSSPAPSLI